MQKTNGYQQNFVIKHICPINQIGDCILWCINAIKEYDLFLILSYGIICIFWFRTISMNEIILAIIIKTLDFELLLWVSFNRSFSIKTIISNNAVFGYVAALHSNITNSIPVTMNVTFFSKYGSKLLCALNIPCESKVNVRAPNWYR